jgi:hypothetical protein
MYILHLFIRITVLLIVFRFFVSAVRRYGGYPVRAGRLAVRKETGLASAGAVCRGAPRGAARFVGTALRAGLYGGT